MEKIKLVVQIITLNTKIFCSISRCGVFENVSLKRLVVRPEKTPAVLWAFNKYDLKENKNTIIAVFQVLHFKSQKDISEVRN